MTIIAKQIVQDKLWILFDGQKKIGKLQANEKDVVLNIGSKEIIFSNTDSVEKLTKIEFERPSSKSNEPHPLYTLWPNTGSTYNDLIDVKRRLHLYTKTETSKCYYVSGWFKLKIENEWVLHFCPKYIFVQRYEYVGPFFTKEQAENA